MLQEKQQCQYDRFIPLEKYLSADYHKYKAVMCLALKGFLSVVLTDTLINFFY